MPRAPTLEKTIDTLIILLFNDKRISSDDLRLLIPLIKNIVNIIKQCVDRD